MRRNLKADNINIHKTAAVVFALNLVEIIMLIGIVIYNYVTRTMDRISNNESHIFIYMVVIVVIINSFITLRYVYSIAGNISELHMLEDTLDKLEDLNTSLRAQRHDFMNHLQVVYGLMEMEEYSDAMKYIDRVYNDIQKVNKFLKTSNPAVNALLQAKVLYAEKRGIDVRMNITTSLKELKIQPWEFCRVLGNLIDNAIYALQEINGERHILIELFEDLKKYGFRVVNNGPEIPEELLEKIFSAGFSTKGENGEGMGLAIVKNIIEGVGGIITVESSRESTVFEGMLPR